MQRLLVFSLSAGRKPKHKITSMVNGNMCSQIISLKFFHLLPCLLGCSFVFFGFERCETGEGDRCRGRSATENTTDFGAAAVSCSCWELVPQPLSRLKRSSSHSREIGAHCTLASQNDLGTYRQHSGDRLKKTSLLVCSTSKNAHQFHDTCMVPTRVDETVAATGGAPCAARAPAINKTLFIQQFELRE